MKKIYLSVVLLLLLLFPIPALAKEGISSFYIDATVTDTGDLNVKELIILNGKFNGFERIINYKNTRLASFNGTITSFYGSSIYNADDITSVVIKDIPVNQNSAFDSINDAGAVFKKTNSADKGDYGVYTLSKKSNGYSYRIFNPSNGKVRGFYIEYKVKNIGVVHDDVAEVSMNLFDELTEYVDTLEMHIHIPNNNELMRGWAHGPLTGNIVIVDNQTIKVTASKIEPNTPIDVRLAFDKSVLSGSTKFSNIKGLDSIIKVETERADSANQKRQQAKEQLIREAEYAVQKFEQNITRTNYNEAISAVNYLPESTIKTSLNERISSTYVKLLKKEKTITIGATTLFIVWIIGLVLLIRRFYQSYDKEYNTPLIGEYYRDFPADYGPEIVGYLLNKKVDTSALSASLTNLIYKKAVLCEKQPSEKKNKTTYLLTTNTIDKDLTPSERQLASFLIGNGSKTLEDIKRKAKKNYKSFISGYDTWKNLATKEAEQENFYEKHNGKKAEYMLYCSIGILFIFTMGINDYIWYRLMCLGSLIISIGCIVYISSSIKRTVKGSEHYRKWMGLKKFLNDFSAMGKRELPEIELWEKYLVYAMPLGCAKKLSKDMEIRIKEFDTSEINGNMFDTGYMYQMFMINNMINQSIASSVAAAYSEKTRQEMSEISHSSSSSGGGFGGGFSGGGGFGGGGGGGGRF